MTTCLLKVHSRKPRDAVMPQAAGRGDKPRKFFSEKVTAELSSGWTRIPELLQDLETENKIYFESVFLLENEIEEVKFRFLWNWFPLLMVPNGL